MREKERRGETGMEGKGPDRPLRTVRRRGERGPGVGTRGSKGEWRGKAEKEREKREKATGESKESEKGV